MSDMPSETLRKAALRAGTTEELLKIIAQLIAELVAWKESDAL